MVDLVYLAKTGSRFLCNSEGTCRKIYSDKKERTIPSYAYIPAEKLPDTIERYQAMLDEKQTDELSLSEFFKRLRGEAYGGEKGIILYLIEEEKGKFFIKKEAVKRIKEAIPLETGKVLVEKLKGAPEEDPLAFLKGVR